MYVAFRPDHDDSDAERVEEYAGENEGDRGLVSHGLKQTKTDFCAQRKNTSDDANINCSDVRVFAPDEQASPECFVRPARCIALA